MKTSAAKLLLCLLPALTYGVRASAQDIPAVIGPTTYQGFKLPEGPGTLTYGLSAGESVRFGYNNGSLYSTTFSGNLGYTSSSTTEPLNLAYSAGVFYTAGGGQGNRPSSVFQSLSVSKTFHIGRYQFSASDSVSYTPDSPNSGYAGIPGLGDVGVAPVVSDPNQTILSNYSARVSNTTIGSVSRALTARTSASASGNYSIQRFVGANPGFDSNNWSASGSLVHVINQISSANVTYSYSPYTFPDPLNPYTFTSQSLTAGYTRSLTRRTSVNISGGPLRLSTTTAGVTVVKYSESVAASAAYSTERAALSASYSRGASAGSGITRGSLTDSLSATYSRPLSRVSSISATASASRNTAVFAGSSNFSSDTFTATLQGSRSIGRYLSAYASYYLLFQNLGGSSNTNTAFSGTSNGISAGISYNPRAIHLGHH